MPAPAIVFDRVGLAFGDKVLFDDLSFTVDSGCCTCLLGPSGCGKSTILKLIAGNPSLTHTGIIHTPEEDHPDSAIAWMAQEDLLLPWMNVLDNVLLGARLRGELDNKLRQRATQLLNRAGLGSFLHALPATLSGGMRQRVALLRTLMEDRFVLLMDEPFSALDALTRIKLQDISAQLTRGATVLLVTHDPMEALRMGNRLLVLSGEPVAITADIALAGSTPRSADDSEIARRYPALLELLLGGDQS
jgi:putative hydroxymethylpyrimidine transport system ATP-binding protein